MSFATIHGKVCNGSCWTRSRKILDMLYKFIVRGLLVESIHINSFPTLHIERGPHEVYLYMLYTVYNHRTV